MAEPYRPSRRELFGLLGGLAGLAACDNQAPRRGFLGAMERWNERVQGALFDEERLAPELLPGSETPLAAFPRYHISPRIPQAPAGWRLRVGGLVRTPVTLSLEELQRLPMTSVRLRHHCVEGWSAVASWQGVRLRDLAERVGLDPRAQVVELRSFDSGYWSTWDLPSALHPQTLLAWGMNGAPLPPGHGAPLRLYSAVKLGYKMVKYLTQVNFLPASARGGYWEDQGYEWFAGV
jgi:DMSO/TMAO reductase YedYZ molybdopterin-dependent catalytic subunit